MKTMRTLFVISAILLVSGYTYAIPGKGPSDSDNIKNSVREQIASAIESSDIEAQGQVTVKFGVTDNNKLQILNIESPDKMLAQEVKEALTDNLINFPKGSQGVYKVKVLVNELMESDQFATVRDQVYYAVNDIQTSTTESVKVKLRLVNPSTIQVLKAESTDQELAQKVKKDLESGNFIIPQKLNGEYNFTVTFK